MDNIEPYRGKQENLGFSPKKLPHHKQETTASKETPNPVASHITPIQDLLIAKNAYIDLISQLRVEERGTFGTVLTNYDKEIASLAGIDIKDLLEFKNGRRLIRITPLVRVFERHFLTIQDSHPRLVELREVAFRRNSQGDSYWQQFPDNDRVLLIEQSAREAIEAGFILSLGYLRTKGLSSFARAIQKFYPGGFESLRKKLGVADTVASQRPRWDSLSDPASVIRTEITQLLADLGGDFTYTDLNTRGLLLPVQKYYPGGYDQLRRDFGLASLRASSEDLTPEKLRGEVAEIIREKGRFSTPIAEALGRSALISQIRSHYPGGISQLLKDLELPPNRRSWTPERIEELARAIFLRDGAISRENLSTEPGLVPAIFRNYPGKLSALQKKMQEPNN